MRTFVAGGSGTIGVPLVRSLVQAGHQLTATTRSAGKQGMLRALGATPVVVSMPYLARLLAARRSPSNAN
jgi:nucleoside-diphosphate-sugar epimerase